MKAVRRFDPPLEEPAGENLVVHVLGAGLDRLGGVEALTRVFNGKLVHEDELKLGSAHARKRFRRAAVDALRQSMARRHPTT